MKSPLRLLPPAGKAASEPMRSGFPVVRYPTIVATLALWAVVVGLGPTVAARSDQRASATGLTIVVLEGEGAINIIQQKTAVAPIVEVRDRNDQPVGGAVVTFAIRGGRATFDGARTLTLTTNAAGRAAAVGLTPTGTGAVQIGASAAFQGQTAMVTIAQTNVLTAAEGAVVGGAGASGGGSTATGATGGGGLSATTIGIIGAAAGGGALVAALEATGSDKRSELPIRPSEVLAGPTSGTYTGAYTGQLPLTFTAGPVTCVTMRALTGTLSVMLQQWPDGRVSGSAVTRTFETIVATNCSQQDIGTGSSNVWDLAVTGTAQSLAFGGNQQVSGFNNVGGTQTRSDTLTFTGGLANGALSGAMIFGVTGRGTNPDGTPTGVAFEFAGSATVAVTLR